MSKSRTTRTSVAIVGAVLSFTLIAPPAVQASSSDNTSNSVVAEKKPKKKRAPVVSREIPKKRIVFTNRLNRKVRVCVGEFVYEGPDTKCKTIPAKTRRQIKWYSGVAWWAAWKVDKKGKPIGRPITDKYVIIWRSAEEMK